MILLTLSRGKGEETVRLQLPASPAEIEETFAFLDRISLDTTATAILDVSSNVPVLYRCLYDVDVEDSEQFQKLQKLAERTEALSPAKAAIFSGALDAECVWNLEGALTVADRLDEYIDDEDGIEQADEFAKRLAQIEREWPESDMVKYKALLSVVDHPSLQDATRLMGEIDQYELRPEVAQTWGYAEMMFREKYSALPEELFQTPQAAQIGQKMLDDRLGVITEYGLIRRKDGQPLPVFQPEQEIGQGLEMM